MACDPDVRLLRDGLYYNRALQAHNVWELDLDPECLDEAARIFHDGGREPFASITQPGPPFEELETQAGAFFAHRVSWNSNVAWVSADDESSLSTLQSIFDRMRLSERFGAVVPKLERAVLFSAFFVTRTRCDGVNYHEDYHREVGTRALTLIAPLDSFAETESFQLEYAARRPEAFDAPSRGSVDAGSVDAGSVDAGLESGREGRREGRREAEEGKDERRRRRYVYSKGKAIVFGSHFLHSTEPGRGRDGETHAFLCFTFGTDDEASWPAIARTLDSQSRIVRHPNGELCLTALGEERARGRPRRAHIDRIQMSAACDAKAREGQAADGVHDALASWIVASGGYVGPVAVEERDGLRGLFVTRAVAEAEPLVAVPAACCLRRAASERHSAAENLILALLAAADGSGSAHAPFIASLPRRPVELLRDWSDPQLERLPSQALRSQARSQLAWLDRLYDRLRPHAAARLRWAESMVRSRAVAWTHREGETSGGNDGLQLVPLLDLANHRRSDGSAVPGAPPILETTDGMTVLVASRSYLAGEEATFEYSSEKGRLLLDWGFAELRGAGGEAAVGLARLDALLRAEPEATAARLDLGCTEP